MMYGLDHLGLAKYGKLAAAEHPQGWAVGCFSNTFGDALPALELLLKTGRCPRVRLQLDWQDNHDYSRRFAAIQKEAARCAAFAKKFPKVDWRFSGACEHKLGKTQATALKDLVLKAAPFVTYVNTPMTGGAWLSTGPKVINEAHGGTPKGARIDFSFDGGSCVDMDVTTIKKTFRNAETFYFWGSRFNGRWSTNDATPRPERKGFPDSRYIDSIIALSKDKGPTSLPDKWIYKSHAENHGPNSMGVPDQKGDRPVMICPIKSSKLELMADNGQIVETLPYYGTFDGNPKGFRYYSDDWGYLLAEKAKRIQGHPVCAVLVDGKVVGTINPAFRDGIFR